MDPLRKISVYRTASRVYAFARTKSRNVWRVLKFSRDSKATELDVVADPTQYSEKECKALLSQINDGNKQHGGLKFVCSADAIIGCFRFLEGFFLLLVTKKRFQGTVCGSKIYGIAASALVSLCSSDNKECRDEQRYRKLISGLELTKDFFFSYDYPLWQSVQATLGSSAMQDPWDPANMFVWNEYLTRPLRSNVGSLWVTPLIHGFWQQRSFHVDGRALTITLVARRSKFFAGTRFRKRGVNDQGHVANHVEVEQICSAGFDMHTHFPVVASMVQVRGSIPLYWEHELGTRKVKPAIHLQRYDPLYISTCLHFQDLAAQYGSPILVLNLVKGSEKVARESVLRSELDLAIKYCNRKADGKVKVQHIPYDFKWHAKQPGADVLQDMAPVLRVALDKTGFFACPPAPPSVMASRTGHSNSWEPKLTLQHGVLRTNCIDCLDRTNVSQFAYGLAALGRQLQSLEITESDSISPRSSLAAQLMDMYEQMGNVISRQYGGSDAHSALFQRERGSWEAATTMRDKLTSLHRFYSNNFSDSERQDAINLFLGHFQPKQGEPPIWELEHDLYLHSEPRRSLLPSIPERPMRRLVHMHSGTSVPDDAICSSGPAQEASQIVHASTGLPFHCGGVSAEAPSEGVQHDATVMTAIEGSERRQETDADKLDGMPPANLSMGAETAGECNECGPNPSVEQPEGMLGKDVISLGDFVPPTCQSSSLTTGSSHASVVCRHGLSSFRMEPNPAKRAKLESFDRKIGRQPTLVQDVRTRAETQKSYLPLWLSSPLGRAGIAKPQKKQLGLPKAESSASLRSSSDSGCSTPVQATPSFYDWVSLPSSPTGSLHNPALRMGSLAHPRSVSVSLPRADLRGRSLSPNPHTNNAGLSSVNASPRKAALVLPAHPSLAFDALDFNGRGSEDAGLATYTEDKSDGGLSLRNAVGTGTTSRDAQEVWKPTPRTASNTQVQLEGRSMSVDWSAGTKARGAIAHLTGSTLKPGSVAPSSTRTSLSMARSDQKTSALGLSPLQHALWSRSPSSDRVWYSWNEKTHTAYDRYSLSVLSSIIVAVILQGFLSAVAAQLQERHTKLLEQQYNALCNPQTTNASGSASLHIEADALWRQRVTPNAESTFGDLSMRSLISAL